MKKLADLVLKYPWLIIGATLALTLLFGFSMIRLESESDVKKLLPENSESVLTYNEIDEEFGGADRLIIVFEDSEICDYDTLSKIRELSAELKDVPGISRIVSLTNMDEIKPVADGIKVAPLLDEIPRERAKLAAFKHKILNDDKYVDNFISSDGKAAMIMAQLFVERDNPVMISEVRSLAEKYKGPEKILITGTPEIAQTILSGMASDMVRLIPLVILLVVVILFLGFRSVYGVVLPLLTVGFATIWSMGTLALIGQPVTVIGSAIPVLLIAVGSAYGIHLIARFDEEIPTNRDELLKKVLTKTGLAILIAAATTAAGFISNVVSDITAIKFFGIITACGIAYAFILTVTLVPAILKLMPGSRTNEQVERKNHGLLSQVLGSLSRAITSRRSPILPITLLILVIAGFGYPRLSTETDPVNYFSKNSTVVKSMHLVKDKFGGSITLDILFDGDLKDPELLRKIETLQKRLEKIDILSKPYSIVDALKETNRYMNNDDPAYDRIPDSREGIAQYLLFLSMSGGDFTDSMITSDHETMLVSCRVATTNSTPVDRMVKQAKQEIETIFGDSDDVEIRLSGMSVVFKDMREMLINNQVQSLILALAVVFLMVLVLYRTPLGALYCMVPIIITLMLNFGIMGWFGIALDMATVLVASIAVGLGIDYSVHFFNRYKEERQLGKSREDSIDLSLRTVGKPIIYNALSVALGFLVLLGSQFALLKNFGILIALTMAFSSFGALAILPELLMIKVRVINLNQKKEKKQ
ncbi:MAG: RND family transporter [Candidatus Saganbacteria bacterium]|nr:RND family transporter [Candidatus Saganbacteria bacterium]